MENLILRRISASTPMVLLLLMIMLLTMPLPAGALLYTYTGLPFTWSYGDPVPPQGPAAGEHMTIRFQYEGPIPLHVDLHLVATGFVMVAGTVELSGLSHPSDNLMILEKTDAGAPSSWVSVRYSAPNDPGGLYELDSIRTGGSAYDEVLWAPPGSGFAYGVGNSATGTWAVGPDPSPVPLPATGLLLGSGLIPLAWARRKKRLGK